MEPNGALNTTDPDLDLNIRKEMSKDSKRASKKERGGKKKSKRSSALPALPKPPYTLTKFSDFVKNHIKEIHSELQKLLSILPNEKHQNRNQLLLQFTLWVKKESAKIRGAYRYLKKRGETLETCRGLITLFHKENAKITKFCQGMTGTYDSFANARVGRFDVPAALDVFEGGTYRTFPKIVEEKIVSPPKLVENEVQNTMSLLTDTIFMRYLTKEAIPEDWQSGVKIDSGKLIFTKKDVYEVCLTLLGTGEDLPWHFVYANIFVKGYDIPKDTEPNRLMDPNQYSRLAYTCQQKLLPDHLKDPIINPMTNQVEPFQQDTDPKFEAIKKAGKTPYLTYLRDYLNKFAIDVQFEILCLQTLKISKTRWSELLKVEIDPAHTVLKLNYWHREDPIEFVKAYKLDNPQCLQIEKSKTGDMVLQVNWTGSSVQTLCKLLNVQQLAKITDEEKQLILNPTSINAEELLLKVIRVHTKLILLKFQELIVSMKKKKHSICQSTIHPIEN
ncbi:hypothetical protein K502DRAFT_78636 [Neoconidiobolus thromboides FSU 785]|nr:hypothetical protein K502DRAFT_78636 [Neoconidiobolus thromboides FSU 785]